MHRDWAHPCHICTGTGLTPPTSAPGLTAPVQVLLVVLTTIMMINLLVAMMSQTFTKMCRPCGY